MTTAVRILEIFEIFAARGRPLTLSELAEELNAPVSSCFVIVRALMQRGYLQSVGARKELYPTRRMLQNATLIGQNEPLLPRLLPILEDLRDRTRETVLLGQLENTDLKVIYLAVFEGLELIRYMAAIGQTRAVDRSATGKALLASLPDKRREAIFKKLKPPQGTTLARYVESLRRELASGEAHGYQRHRGQNVVDVASIARAVRVGDRLFAVGVSGPKHRMEESLSSVVESLARNCARIEELT